MESNQEETKSLPLSEENKADVNQKDYDFKKLKDLQTLFDKLSEIEQLMFELDRLKEAKNFEQIKNIDLIKFMRGTQYSTNIEQFFDFDLAIKKIEEGFGKLQCSYPQCEFQAMMAFKGKNGEPTIQYCDHHFNNSNNSTKSPKIFEYELKLHKILFYELEEQLIYIQDRVDYIKSDKTLNNISLYDKIEEEVKRNLDNIKITLKTMTERIYQIYESYNSKTKNKASMINFDDLSFVKKDLSECRENILAILSLISGPCSKNQSSFLIRVMTDFKRKINLEEERKEDLNSSVSNEIYNSEYQMVDFPAQSFQTIKNFEEKISTYCKYMETCQKDALELVKSFIPFKQIFQEQLNQLLIEEQKYKEAVEAERMIKLKEDHRPYTIKEDHPNNNKYLNTLYFKYFEETPEYPDLKETIDDLKQIFPFLEHKFKVYYEDYKDKPAECVTLIWTSDAQIAQLINFALIVDACKEFNFNKKSSEIFEKYLINQNLNAEKVIKYSIKFIKLLNSYIYDLGTGFNTVKRQVYRGLRAEVLKDVKEGDVFRFS